jgi:hypothetical protein
MPPEPQTPLTGGPLLWYNDRMWSLRLLFYGSSPFRRNWVIYIRFEVFTWAKILLGFWLMTSWSLIGSYELGLYPEHGGRAYVTIRMTTVRREFCRVGYGSGKALDSYSGSIRFESRQAHRLSRLRLIVDFLILPLGQDRFLRNPFQFITNL